MVLAAVGQICSTANLSHNLAQCVMLIQKASQQGAKALFLPEASDYIASTPSQSLTLAQPLATSPFVSGIQAAARTHALAVSIGIHEPIPSKSKVANTLLWIDASGSITQKYRKLHLFDVDIANGPVLKESNSVEKGTEVLPPFDTELGKVGAMICFDLRFPEISLRLRRLGAQVLTYPSAFTVRTGRAHWETLLRARAIETQSYVFAAAQCGVHDEEGKRTSYGHSMVVDPWGDVLAELGGWDEGKKEEDGVGRPEIRVIDIDLESLHKVRKEVPLLRRTDVYGEV